ncbi:MAG: substrate-binding domain-containing protein [Marinobacterium sp.]|nr:substrate-binding domain-containing protein [Marinobacterium sp.]
MIINFRRLFITLSFSLSLLSAPVMAEEKKLAYLVSDIRIPFWNIMWKGIHQRATELGYRVTLFSAKNNTKKEIENTVEAITQSVDGLILSPTNSSAAVTVLKLAKKADVPVVISDIGTQAGRFVSYIESDNKQGAYQLGKILARDLKQRGLENGTVGIIAIPQRRANGKARTEGFLRALGEEQIRAADIRQQKTFSYKETFDFTRDLIQENPDLVAVWLQGSDRYQGALDAINVQGKKGQIRLICFDAEPEFIDMIRQDSLVGAGMQQPFLMGERAVVSMHQHLSGQPVSRHQKLEVLAVSSGNLTSLLPIIQRNVLGFDTTAAVMLESGVLSSDIKR